MIQGFTESNITAFLSTEDNRIDTAAGISKIRFLVKLINDMNGDVEYCYPSMGKGILPRYTQMIFTYNVAPDRYAGTINLLPAGHWKYEVYEVVWIETPVVAFGNAPATETDVLPVANTNGIVKGIVTKGILNLTEKLGTEQVQYDQHESPNSPNYVWYGEDIDIWNPADESSIVAFYKNKTGLTLVGDKVTAWEDSSANSFNMLQSTTAQMPSYTASTGGVVFDATDHLQSISAFTLSAQFTIAFKIKANTYIGDILSDKGTVHCSVELSGITALGVTNTLNAGVALTTTTGNWQDAYVVVTRNAANLVQMTVNGILQTNSDTMTGEVRFNILGSQLEAADNFDGSLFELQVYNSTSSTLTTNINERLSNL
tara:strand:- start:1305 stop:2420 length:1116 start_codon:yes stop_codon:yes gene_type:complete